MRRTRLLTPREKKIVRDALIRAACETRMTRHEALARELTAGNADQLAQLAHEQERLATEVNEHDIRLER